MLSPTRIWYTTQVLENNKISGKKHTRKKKKKDIKKERRERDRADCVARFPFSASVEGRRRMRHRQRSPSFPLSNTIKRRFAVYTTLLHSLSYSVRPQVHQQS